MKQRANEEIRKKIKDNGIFQWEVAEALGVSEVTLIRWLRVPVSDTKKEELVHAISEVSTKDREA